jgi:hypothetical protein
MAIQLKTKPALKAAIKTARAIKAQIRFGCSERWVQITKTQAYDLIADIDAKTTPDQMEMFSGQFGELDGATLYLG